MGLNSKKQFRKRVRLNEEEKEEVEEDVRMDVEEIRLLQKQRERRRGLAADGSNSGGLQNDDMENTRVDGGANEEGAEELVLQDTFAQETAVHVEDPNMLKYIEQEMAKKKGKNSDEQAAQRTDEEDELYKIPEHLKVKRSIKEDGLSSWTTGIVEVQLPIEYKVKNIEATEAAKKALQDRQPFSGRGGRQGQNNLPASFSADFHQRGKEYAEKFRTDPGGALQRKAKPPAGEQGSSSGGGTNARQVATDEILLERFKKRERSRLKR